MTNRARDWLRQAEADLRLARLALDGASFEWACFASQQSAEKALKAAFMSRGSEAWGHSVAGLLGQLDEEKPPGLEAAGKRLDKHYVPARYPNGLPEGAPTDSYTAEEAEAALRDSEAILEFSRRLVEQ